ncbi:MAG: translocation/assembly module TamB, partial [Chitinophagaceae bacterium]|nr:translocation/assembly module TamB [Chitinophagaceae bacterium]
LSVDDPHIRLALEGSSDISGAFPSLKLNANIDNLQTFPLHLTADTIAYRGHIAADFPVTDPDRPEGDLYITGSALSVNGKMYTPDTISLIAGGSDTGRFMRFNSDALYAEISGQYRLTKLGSVFTQAIEPYFSLKGSPVQTPRDQRNEHKEAGFPLKTSQGLSDTASATASTLAQKSPPLTTKNTPGVHPRQLSNDSSVNSAYIGRAASASPAPANANNASTTTDVPDSLDKYDFSVKAALSGGPLLNVFAPDLELSEPVMLSAHFDNDNWQTMVNAPQVKMGENSIHAFALNAGTKGNAIHLETGFNDFSSGGIQLYKTSLSGDIADNNINLLLNIADKNHKNKYRLGANLSHPTNSEYTLSLQSDSLMLNYDPWTIDPENRIRMDRDGLNIRQFALRKNGQQLLLNSASPESNAPLEIQFDQFRIATIAAIAAQDSLLADGTINGSIEIRDLAQQPNFTGDLTINQLSIKQDTVGDLALKVNNTRPNIFHADIALSGKENDVALSGEYHLKPANQSAFDLALDIRKLQMSSLEAFSMGAITQATGYIDGRIDIKGSIEQPDINGKLQFNKTSFSPAILGSLFSIDKENITINKEGIRFDNFTVRDSANNLLNINGTASTNNFINYRFDMDVQAENFQALNSVRQADRLFYGQFYFDTDLHIGGTEVKPVVEGELKVNESTRLTVVLPQESPGIVEREGVIRFVNPDSLVIDSTISANDSISVSDIRGMDVSVNIEIDKKAELTLIIDEANGDFLKMKGTGQLNGGIDPSGKTTLTGTYEIEEGAYELSFNFLKRKFNIRKGGKITWLGEPTRANIDLTAIYTAATAPLSLVENQIDVPNINIYKQRLPFEVNLLLSGELLKPEIKFDIALPADKNYHVDASVIENVETRLTQLRSETSELNKQVFALLLLNRFVSENPFAGGGGMSAESAVRESVSRILSDQLNNLAADLIKGVDLNFDLESTDDYTTGNMENRTDLNISLSKSLLNDRLRVTVGSNFELEGPQRGSQKTNNLAGNVALDYLLSKDGRYMLRAYRKNNYEGQLDGYIIETGLNFIITLDYNRFREIFHLPQQPQRRAIKQNRSDEKPGAE